MNEEKYYREVQTRERLVQIFLVISGFLLAYSLAGVRQFLVLTFIIYIIFVILYYIFLTRTENDFMISFFGFFCSYVYSLFLLVFINTQLNNSLSALHFYSTFILFTAIFTFAFLAPNHSERLVNRFEKSANKFGAKHPKLLKTTVVILMAIMLIYVLIQTIQNFMK